MQTQQKQFWTPRNAVPTIFGGIIFIYLCVMTYFYFSPILDFSVELPMNPPSILEPKQQSIQTHIGAPRLPFGLETLEFIVVPPYRTNFYANIDGGALIEKKTKNSINCTTTLTTDCIQLTTKRGQRYFRFTTRDSSRKVSDVRIVFDRGQTNISIELTKRPRELDADTLNNYIDSFQPVHASFPVDHFTPGP